MSNRTNILKTLEKRFLPKAKGKQKERVREFLDLYKSGKIFSKITIQRELNRYLGRHPSETARELHYYKTLVKYMGNESALDKRKEAKIEKQQEKIKTLIKASKKITTPKTNYTVKATLYSDVPNPNNPARPWRKYGYEWYPATHANFDVKVKGEFPSIYTEVNCRRR